jgi:hypothetical protein
VREDNEMKKTKKENSVCLDPFYNGNDREQRAEENIWT